MAASRAGDLRTLEYSRRYRQENRERILEAREKRHLADPRKRQARRAVERELRKGTLVKQPCEVCAGTERIQAHHDDYDKPLDIRWLCPKHHAKRHQELGW